MYNVLLFLVVIACKDTRCLLDNYNVFELTFISFLYSCNPLFRVYKWLLTIIAMLLFLFNTGFGLLESGSVSIKNELNIMIKNAVDVVFGGLSYWICGYGFSFGDGEYSNAFFGWGHFCVTVDDDNLGIVYSKFFFQASFATTATTIVSG